MGSTQDTKSKEALMILNQGKLQVSSQYVSTCPFFDYCFVDGSVHANELPLCLHSLSCPPAVDSRMEASKLSAEAAQTMLIH
eukprot:1161420-Pelagomonas_calceolata.AAC.3